MFKLDSPLMNFLNKIADIMILNMLFIFFCMPIITIGASFSAAYYIGFKMVRDQESYIIRGFWKAFRENFKQATIMWLIVLAAIIILFFDYRIILYSGLAFPKWMLMCMITVTIVLLMGAVYMFALQAHFMNTVKNTIKNSFLMALSHLPTTFLLIATYAIPIVIFYFIPRIMPALFLLGFGCVLYLKAILLLKVFRKYEEAFEQVEQGAEDSDEGIFAQSEPIENEEDSIIDERNHPSKVFQDGRFIEVAEKSAEKEQ